MNCTEFLAQLEEIAAERPDFELPAELQQHARTCAACENECVAMREAWMSLPASLDAAAIRPDFEESVMRRIESAPKVSLPPETVASGGIWKYVVAASVLFALIAVTMSSSRWFGGDKAEPTVRELARQMEKLEELERTFARPELRYVSLTSTGTSERVQGYLVYDLVGMEGHFFGYGMAQSNHYVLWLLGEAGQVISSQLIDVNDENLGAVTISLPSDVSILKEVVVSEEQSSQPSTPSGNLKMRCEVSF